MEMDIKIRNLLRLKHCLFPPSAKQMRKYLDRGAYDAEEFLMKHDLWTDEDSSGGVADGDEDSRDVDPSDNRSTMKTNGNNNHIVDGLFGSSNSYHINNIVFESGV